MTKQTTLEQEEQQVLSLLKGVNDPELGINIIDLGLVYTIESKKDTIEIQMTLTTQGCPMGGAIMEDVNQTLEGNFPDKQISVMLVWEPPWSPEMISEGGMRQLGW